jgi:hypothetical protein
MLIVTGADEAAVALLVAALVAVLVLLAVVLLVLLLVQAAAVRTMPATAPTAIIGR